MSDYIEWLRPSGNKITLESTPNLTAYAEKAGWEKCQDEAEIQKAFEGLISDMDKDSLEAFTLKEFGIDIDKRKNIEKLRSEVEVLIQSEG